MYVLCPLGPKQLNFELWIRSSHLNTRCDTATLHTLCRTSSCPCECAWSLYSRHCLGRNSSAECTRVCNCHIKQEVKDVLKFSALCPAAVIPTQLIISIDTTHVLIVQNDGFRTRDGCTQVVFCRRRADPIADGCVLLAITITTFLSIQAYAATPPFWTISSTVVKWHLQSFTIVSKILDRPNT